MGGAAPLSFKAFLSHSYSSPRINLYFFNIFNSIGVEVQFEVDAKKGSTNVTRLERMIRGSDAFIGIYPFEAADDSTIPTHAELLKESRYFRLELDMAMRSRKPVLIFYDQLYGSLFRGLNGIRSRQFDSLEVLSAGGFPSEVLHRRVIQDFCDTVRAAKAYEVSLPEGLEPSGVGLLLPDKEQLGSGYARADIELVQATLQSYGFGDLRTLPPGLTREQTGLVQGIDWVVADIGEPMTATLVAYLHGCFVPAMRLLRRAHSPLEDALYGVVDVGYRKDILRWNGRTALKDGLERRLQSLRLRPKRISTAEGATEYFQGASLRTEKVFVSYSGRDQEVASRLSQRLKETFKDVFDYRDGESIPVGSSWLDHLTGELVSSAIGIALLSPDYLNSGNCEQELRLMVAYRNDKKMRVIPVKLKREVELPPYIQDIEYLRWWNYDYDPAPVVEAAMRGLAERS
jgi:TIR domain